LQYAFVKKKQKNQKNPREKTNGFFGFFGFFCPEVKSCYLDALRQNKKTKKTVGLNQWFFHANPDIFEKTFCQFGRQFELSLSTFLFCFLCHALISPFS
jgi:hypothetical protein